MPGLSFFSLSLISIEQRCSFPISIEQVIKQESEKQKKTTEPPTKQGKKNKGGRPKGSQIKSKSAVTLTPEILRIKGMIQALMQLFVSLFSVNYLVLDGHFGNNNAAVMSRQVNLHIIFKLRQDSALYLPYKNPDQTRISRRKYGEKLDCQNITSQFLKKTSTEKDIQTDIYQAQLLHQEFAQPLNVVILVKTNLLSQARMHVILFSTDLDLAEEKLIDYYSLRFQIEFNFRDAKQFWGLEDFMNVSKTSVTNAANLSFFMVNFSHHLLHHFRRFNPDKGCD